MLVGQRFGILTLVEELPQKNNLRQFLLRCDCGNLHTGQVYGLTRGLTTSCGCLTAGKHSIAQIRPVDGMAAKTRNASRTYLVWLGMKKRCYNRNCKSYPRYGGRGIVICLGWLIFDNFFKDMGESTRDVSIERKDVNGHYSCGKCTECNKMAWTANCKWADRYEQANNTRVNRKITFNGYTLTMMQWVRKTGISLGKIRNRLKNGWPLHLVFSHDFSATETRRLNKKYKTTYPRPAL